MLQAGSSGLRHPLPVRRARVGLAGRRPRPGLPLDEGFRIAHHGPKFAANPAGFAAWQGQTGRGVRLRTGVHDAEVKITAIRVNHAPVAPGLRLSHRLCRDARWWSEGHLAATPLLAGAGKPARRRCVP